MRNTVSSSCLALLLLRSLLLVIVVVHGEDVQNGDNYARDLSIYTMQTASCFRVKIVNDNDDDGNSYFYNGAYRAQYTRYVSYSLCPVDTTAYGDCQTYVIDLNTYLESTIQYVQGYCNSCANMCRRALMRALDGNDAEDIQANCNTCKNECSIMTSKSGNGVDESDYLECQEGENDGEMQYYTAPQCENGKIVIGRFYDDECTIKTTTFEDSGFSYATFETIGSMTFDCGISDACADIFDESVHCQDGYSGDQQEATLCKAAASAMRVQTFYTESLWQNIPLGLIVFLSMIVCFACGFLSHTYYVRHLRIQEKQPMAELDQTDLPKVS